MDLSREAVIAVSRVAPKDPQVWGEVVRLLGTDRDLDRRSLLKALETSGQLALATDWLAGELVSDRHGLRGRAAKLLLKCGVRGTASLAEALTSEDPGVGERAIYMLAHEEKVGPAVFVATLSDAAPEMRRAAIHALVRRNAVEAAPKIASLLSDPDAALRLRAAKALFELNVMVPEAGPGLVRLAAEGDEEFAMWALEAMRSTGFAPLATFLECGLEVPAEPRIWAMRLRPSARSEELIATLHLLIASLEDNRHGAALVTALRETLAKDEDAILIEDLAADESELRRAAAILLGHLARDREAATRALEKALKDEDPDVRAAAAAAIERVRSTPR